MFETPATPSIHDHVTGQRQVVRLELRHLVHLVARRFVGVLALQDVAHRQRRADHDGAADRRAQR
jgi:hypothetical protein